MDFDGVRNQLHQSPEMLSSIFNLNPDAIALTRASDGKFIDCNQEFLNQIGYSREEVIGHTSLELNLYRPEDRQRYVNEIKRQGDLYNFELRLKRKDDSFFDVLYSARIITIDDEQIILNIGKDITGRKNAEKLSQKMLEKEQQLTEELQTSNEELQSTTEELQTANEELQNYQNELLEINQILKKNQHEIRTERNNLRTILDSMDDGVYIVSKNYDIEYANPVIKREFGEVRGKCYEYLHNKEAICPWCNIENVLNGKTSIWESYFTKTNKFYELYNTPIINPDGSVSSLQTLHNITERKRMENEIRNENQKLLDIIEFLPDATFAVDNNNDVIAWNMAIEQMTGVSKEEILGKGGFAYSVPFYGEKRPMLVDYVFLNETEFEDKYDFIMRDGNILYAEMFLDDFQGKSTYFFGKASPLYDGEGNIVGSIETIRDVTNIKIAEKENQELLKKEQLLTEELQTSNEELQDANEELQTANEELQSTTEELQTANEKLDVVNEELTTTNKELQVLNKKLFETKENYLQFFNNPLNGFILFEIISDDRGEPVDFVYLEVNHAFENITEIKREDVLNKKITDVLQPEDAADMIKKFGKVVLNCEKAHFTHYRRSIDKYIEIFAFSPRTNKFIAFFVDITKRKKAELELEKTMEELKRSNGELEQFAYVASHDLQEPLRMVTSFTQLLERQYKNQLDEDADDYLEFIVDGAQRMKALIDDLLAFSRLKTQTKKFESIDLKTTIEDILLDLQAPIEDNNAQITYESLPIIKGDPSQIRQLLQNLISNAIKFHDDAPPEIHISAQKSIYGWTFSVSDNGIGIDPEHQEQIFNVFNRLHKREEYPGSGIGLAICKKIVESHGGKIWVESEPDKGSIFYFNIPK